MIPLNESNMNRKRGQNFRSYFPGFPVFLLVAATAQAGCLPMKNLYFRRRFKDAENIDFSAVK